jgi:hypothetical protein
MGAFIGIFFMMFIFAFMGTVQPAPKVRVKTQVTLVLIDCSYCLFHYYTIHTYTYKTTHYKATINKEFSGEVILKIYVV